jgi:hypothetical protein
MSIVQFDENLIQQNPQLTVGLGSGSLRIFPVTGEDAREGSIAWTMRGIR